MKKFLTCLTIFIFCFFGRIVFAELPDPDCFVNVTTLPKQTVIFVSQKETPQLVHICSFRLKKDKDLKKFLEWYNDKLPAEEIVKKVEVVAVREEVKGKKSKRKIDKIKKKKEKVVYVEQIKRSGIMDGAFFYLLSKEGRVIEIQGVGDFLKLYYTAKYKKEIDVPFRNQITFLALQDILGIKNRGSKILGAKAGFGAPFFLTVEDFLSGIELVQAAYKALTRESKMLELLDSLPSDRDKCLVIKVQNIDRKTLDSERVLQKIWIACKSAYSKATTDTEKLPLIEAMSRVAVRSIFGKKNIVSREDLKFIASELDRLQEKARSCPEKSVLEMAERTIASKI